MSQRPEIGELQLAAWQKWAKPWPITIDDNGHVRCLECDVSIWRMTDDNGQDYAYKDGELLALKVAHLRQCHANLESKVYQEAGIKWLI